MSRFLATELLRRSVRKPWLLGGPSRVVMRNVGEKTPTHETSRRQRRLGSTPNRFRIEAPELRSRCERLAATKSDQESLALQLLGYLRSLVCLSWP
jgi:hypothetical protein